MTEPTATPAQPEPESAPELSPEPAPELSPEPAPELSPEPAPELSPELSLEWAPEPEPPAAGEELDLPFGPLHPPLGGVLPLALAVDGDRIVACRPRIGH